MNPTSARSMNLARKAPAEMQVFSVPESIAEPFYTYSCFVGGTAGIATTASGSNSVTIQADSQFMVMALTAAVYVSNALVATPYSTVQINDTGSGANLFDQPQIIGSIFGTAQQPSILPRPRQLLPSATLTFTVSNLNSAANAFYYFSLLGRKIYSRN